MIPKNQKKIADRVIRAAEASLAAKGFVAAIDVLIGMGWCDPGAEKRWRMGQIDCLEGAVQANLSRVSEAMKAFRSWATQRKLLPSETDYVARAPGRRTLRFSRSGDPAIEKAYRTHWVSPALSEKKRERLAAKASRPPELVVYQPLHDDWTCHRCKGTGGLLILENKESACLSCVGLGDLEFLPSGDALMTRRAKEKSARFAVVVRFSKARERYERQGLLVEPKALADAQKEIEEQKRA